MRNSFLGLLRQTFLAAVAAALPATLVGQVANNNPTGSTGVFNGNSETGCSYDPYTGNATRTIPDLVVSGAVGSYPLAWARTMNSRGNGYGALGAGGGWRHSYLWSCTASNDANPFSPTPTSYTVSYPDGRVITFSGSPMVGPLGVKDRFGGVSGTGDVYLYLPDGGQVKFRQTAIQGGGEYQFYMASPSQITQPGGLVTTLTYDGSLRLVQVTEPAQRWLKVVYDPTYGTISEVDAGYGSNTLTQTVTYGYASRLFGGQSYRNLTSASYSDGTGASYTYQNANTSSGDTPLLSTCADVRYPGPMKNITYTFKSGGAYGQLYQEKDTGATSPVVTLAATGNTRTETRGDGASRTFTYGATVAPYLLKTYTDFLAAPNTHSTTLSYDSRGLVSSVLDFNNHTTGFVNHVWSGAVTKITHPGDSSTIQYGYDPNGYFLESVTDELNHITTYNRHLPPNLTAPYEIDYPGGGVEKFTYNSFGQPLTHTMVSNTATAGSGGVETFIYDTANRGLLWKSYPPQTASDSNPSAHPTIRTYDVNDHLSTVQDPLGNVTTLQHNQRGQLTIIQSPDADQSLIGYGYNDDGTLLNTNVQFGPGVNEFANTQYTYDDYKRVKTVISPGHNTPLTISTFYGPVTSSADDYTHTDANVTRSVLPSGKVLTKVYDSNKRPSSVTTGYGTSDAATTGYTYDAGGNLMSKTEPKYYPNGAHWSYTYDARDRLYYLDDPTSANLNSDGHTVSYHYDVVGNKTSELPANNQAITYDSYDPMNRLLQMTVGQFPNPPAVTNYSYTNAGKVATMKDPTLNTYTYTYDALNRPDTVTYPPDGGGVARTESKRYDIAGNLLTYQNRMGQTQTFSYDSRNRSTGYTWDDGVTLGVTQTYDDASRMLTCNTVKTSITFTYFKDNLLQSEEEWTGYFGDNNHRTLNYTYDTDGNRASVGLPGTATSGYAYTNRDQLKSVTNGISGPSYVDYSYDLSGNLTGRTPNNGTSSTFGYDALNRLSGMTSNFTGQSRTLAYGFDVMSNRTYVQRTGDTNSNHPKDDGYGYDFNNQLNSFYQNGTLAGQQVTTGTHTTLTFDAAGSRTNLTIGGNSTTYNPTNQLNLYTIIGGANLTYWGNGTLHGYNSWSYTYDAMNRLTVATNGTITANFYYDGLNRQIARSITGEGTTFNVWDGWQLYAEFTTGNVLSDRWIYGAGGDLVMSPIQNQYYYPDGSGSTSYLAGSLGYLLETYTYDAFGTVKALDANDNALTTPSISLLYNRQKWYSQLGLYDLRHRAYMPSIGRFLQPDPIGFAGDASNLYRYCGNNSVNWSDPSGLGHFYAPLPKRKDGGGDASSSSPSPSTSAGELPGIGSIGGDVSSGPDSPRGGDFTPRTNAPNTPSNNVAVVPGFNLTRSYFPGTGGITSLNLNGSVTETIPLFSDGITDATSSLINALSLLNIPRDAFLLGAGLVGLAENGLTTVMHFTSAEGVTAITEAAVLRTGTYVTLPGEVAGLNSLGVESTLEIQAGRGAFSTTFEVPNSFLQIPANGARTSGGALQFQLMQPAVPGVFIPTP